MNEEKYNRIIDLLESLHKEILYTFLHREISLEISRLTRSKSFYYQKFDHLNFEDSTSIKKHLFELIVNLKEKYKKILELKENVRDIYEEIIEEINKEFPVFPHDFTEFLFEKTMNKAFKEDKIINDNYHYTHQLINKVVNNKKTYKYP